MKYILVILTFLLIVKNGFTQTESVYIITVNGAVAGGDFLCTKSIQQTIDECYKKGGGTVYVPAGIYKTGTIFLKSNVSLYLETGAVLKGSENLADYFEYILPEFGKNYYGLVYTDSAVNVSITGQGIIDGNNQVFFDWDKAKKIEWGGKQFTRQKDNFSKVQQGVGDGPVTPKDRPRQMIVFARCRNVDVKNVQLLNSPFWTLHFADCDGVAVSGIRLFTNMLVPNADGIDITSCSNVVISDCDIRAGDDAIAITGYDHHFEIPGYHRIRHISENIVISNCNLQSFSSAIRIGFLDQNTVRNIQVSNVNITNSSRGIGIFVRDEGSLENISFSNMYIQTALHTGDWWGNGEPIHISAVRGNDNVKLGQITHVQFSNIICKGENGMLLYGSAESIIEDVSFSNVRFEFTDSKLNEVAGGNVDLRGCSLTKQLFERGIPGILVQYINGLQLHDVQLSWTNTRMPYFTNGIELDHFNNVSIHHFEGSGSPVNKKAFRIMATNGKNLVIDERKNVLLKNVL